MLRDHFLGSNLDGIGFLLRIGSGDRDIALGVRLGNLGIFADLLHIVNSHIFNGSGRIFKVLDIEIHHFDAQFLHIRHHILGNFFCDALPILYHLFESDRTDDFTHVAF